MAKRDLNWKKVGETSILREEVKETQEGFSTERVRVLGTEEPKERAKHRLTVDIYEDQFMAMEIRKATRVAGTVTDQLREALDQYLAAVEKNDEPQESSR
ncbi:hypothetical protein BH24DEI2_BH24DEI2_08450 [soil metagenome]